LKIIDHGSIALKISKNYPVGYVMLKSRPVEINHEIEPYFRN